MKVWVVTTTGIMGAEVKGVFPSAGEALKVMVPGNCVAVEMELGVDYSNHLTFVIITKDKPVPRQIRMPEPGKIPDVDPTL